MVTNLKRLFKKTPEGEPPLPFKQFNALNTLEPQNLTDLLQFAEQQQFFNILPDLKNKKGLFVSLSPATLSLIEKNLLESLSLLVNYQVNFSAELPTKNCITLKGALNPMSLKDSSFDLVFFPFAPFHSKDLLDFLPSLSRVLKNGGRALFSVIHPTLEIFIYNQNPASTARSQATLQAYFQGLKENNLYLEHLAEAIIDKETKPFFKIAENNNSYEDLKGIPLVLFLRAVKFVR